MSERITATLPFAARVIVWPARIAARVALWLVGAACTFGAVASLVAGESLDALAFGLVAGLAWETRRWVG